MATFLLKSRMKREIKPPSPKEFCEKVKEMVEKYEIIDCIYKKSVEEFSTLTLVELKEIHKTRILKPFLLDWGKMGRWLGHSGVEKIFLKIKTPSFASRIEPLRPLKLQSVNLNEYKREIIAVFDELSQTEFKTGKTVNSTATSKVLHLCCPDLFVMWDANIRSGYRKNNGDGQEYFEFLCKMQQDFLHQHQLSSIIRQFEKEYGLKPTRLIDLYNWAKFSARHL